MKIIKRYDSQINFDSSDYRTVKFSIPRNHIVLDIRLISTCDVLFSVIIDDSDMFNLVELELFFLINNNIVQDDMEYIKTVEFYGYVYSVFRKIK